ncbi:MAG TPA: hydantoinase/oxoprolinase family protein [Rhodothermales bacterium]
MVEQPEFHSTESYRPFTIGVDIGGTFTDLVLLDQDGGAMVSKAPTTPKDFSMGVLDAIGDAASQLGVSVQELLRKTELVKHGSTVATNALITRQGVRVGLITTHGFEDTPLIMRAVGRVDGLPEEEVRHTTGVTKPRPLVDPRLIRGVRERIDSEGAIAIPLNLSDVRTALRDLIDTERIDALAVSLINAWVNPAHEQRIRDEIGALFADAGVYLSFGSDLSQIAGEYARTNTAIANAFVGPTVERYLANLESALHELGFEGRLLVMQGNGGLTGREQATPISTLQSGPAGGMLASARTGERLGHRNIITADMGGTSFDVGLINDGYWRYADEPIFERFRIQQPITAIESIGAGGGTIARVDAATSRLLVGPESAGALPGPVCYGAGGTEPTVTDCDLLLGYLDPDYFLGGRRRLDMGRAEEAVRERIAEPLGMDVMAAAAGISRIINSKMTDLIRREVVRRGHSPEEYVLYAFGGAGPVHAAAYAKDLGIRQIYVFPTSSVFSAFGISAADLVHTRLATRYYRLPVAPDDLNADLEQMELELRRDLDRDGFAGAIEFNRYFTMRFARQTTGEEVALPWDTLSAERVAALEDLFVERYEELYGRGVAYRQAGIEISSIRVDAVGRVDRPDVAPADRAPSTGGAMKGRRRAYFDGEFVETPVYEYELLAPGAELRGPAIVESPFTTVVLPPDSGAELDAYRNVVVTL